MSLDVIYVGDSVIDLILPVERFPRGNEDVVQGKKIKKELGGAANFLLLASRLGLKVGIIDSIGNDEFGCFYINKLKSEGIDTSRIYIREGLSTHLCLTLLDQSGNHAFIGISDAGLQLTPDEIDLNYIRDSKIVFISGYTLREDEYPVREAVLQAVKVAHQSRIPIFFDPGPALLSIPRKTLLKVTSLSKAILLNDREAKMMTKLQSVKEAAEKLLELGADLVVVKCGDQGCFLRSRNESLGISTFPVRVVDTTGAGDTFNAAFTYGYLKNWSLRDTATFANAVGAITVTKFGAGTQVPTKDEVSRFLDKHEVDLNI